MVLPYTGHRGRRISRICGDLSHIPVERLDGEDVFTAEQAGRRMRALWALLASLLDWPWMATPLLLSFVDANIIQAKN